MASSTKIEPEGAYVGAIKLHWRATVGQIEALGSSMTKFRALFAAVATTILAAGCERIGRIPDGERNVGRPRLCADSRKTVEVLYARSFLCKDALTCRQRAVLENRKLPVPCRAKDASAWSQAHERNAISVRRNAIRLSERQTENASERRRRCLSLLREIRLWATLHPFDTTLIDSLHLAESVCIPGVALQYSMGSAPSVDDYVDAVVFREPRVGMGSAWPRLSLAAFAARDAFRHDAKIRKRVPTRHPPRLGDFFIRL